MKCLPCICWHFMHPHRRLRLVFPYWLYMTHFSHPRWSWTAYLRLVCIQPIPSDRCFEVKRTRVDKRLHGIIVHKVQRLELKVFKIYKIENSEIQKYADASNQNRVITCGYYEQKKQHYGGFDRRIYRSYYRAASISHPYIDALDLRKAATILEVPIPSSRKENCFIGFGFYGRICSWLQREKLRRTHNQQN